MAAHFSLEIGPPTDEGFFRIARLWWYSIWILTLVCIALIGTDMLVRSRYQDEVSRDWIGHLDLFAPAFYPSGTAQRHPEILQPAIDMRFGPFSGRIPP